MKRIVLANSSYLTHMTDEGWQLQAGLAAHGWELCGPGFADNESDVDRIIARTQPDVVFIQDARDWDRASHGAFRRTDLHFDHVESLASHRDIFKVIVVKDAGSCIDYQHEFAAKVGANAAIVYYHPESVLRYSTWLHGLPLIRHHHTVDAKAVASAGLAGPRRRAMVSGAMNPRVYPLRTLAVQHANELHLAVLPFPGYGNQRCRTPDYLRELAGFKVHVATASRYGFALRKIVESVACGCTPVTNLPAYDTLPHIDGALIRVPDHANLIYLGETIRRAVESWCFESRMEWSRRALAWYDYRAAGKRLDSAIMEAATCASTA